MRKCKYCGNEIPEGRLKILPKTTTCVKCSDTEKVAGFPLITGKTEYCDLQIVDQETCKKLNKLQNRKGYGISNGVKFDQDRNKTSKEI